MSASSGYGIGGVVPPGPSIETLTGNVGGPVGPTANNINIVGAGGVLVTGNPGTSTLTITAPGEAALYTEDTGTAAPSAGNLNIFGGNSTAGKNIHTSGAGSTVSIILNDSLLFPLTNTTGTEGVLFWNGSRFLHSYSLGGTGNGNTFLGENAGSLTSGAFCNANTGIGGVALQNLTGTGANLGIENVGVGNFAGNQITNGSFNVAIGNGALDDLTTGTGNVAVGTNAGTRLVTGARNILIGPDDNTSGTTDACGYNYTGAESDNILFANEGVTGENSTIRIGTDGAGVSNQNAFYAAGIYNRSFASPSGVVQIDHNFKLGSSAGNNGQLLIGSTGASPVWANLTSAGATIVITNAPGGINLEATGTGAGASQFPTDLNGPADEAGGILNIFGGPGILSGVVNIHTNAVPLSNTVRIVLNDSLKFPITHADGSGGVLYWNNIPTIQFLGSGNTFLGSGAGNLTLTTGSAIDNTAVGENCLPALTTSPENTFIGSNAGTLLASGSGLNTAAGFAVLDNLVSGSNNIAIGTLAGTDYTSNESNNIVIGSFGTVGDNQTIRIGRTQTAAYMQGVYQATIGSTNAPVYIDNTGKLGTKEGAAPGLEGSSFMAVVPASGETLPSLNTQTYLLGTNLVETILWDDFSGAFFPGDGVGTPASFTAPLDGRYEFKWEFRLTMLSVSSLDSFISVNGTQMLSYHKPNYQLTGNFSGSFYVSGLLTLNAGDSVTFGTSFIGSALNPITFSGGNPPLFPYRTWVSGTLIKTTP